jgi:hypothetical protein
VSDTRGPGSPPAENPLDVLAQAAPAEKHPTKAAASSSSARRASGPADGGPPTEPVAAAPPRTARNLTKARRNPKPTPAAARGAGATITGIILVLVAVGIGAVLLTMGYDREKGLVTSPPTNPSDSTSTLVPNSPVGNAPGLPSSTNSSLKPPSAVVVKVGKAGAPEGVASAGAEKLKSAGYTQSAAFDSSQSLAASKVFYQPGFQAEAGEVAKVFKIPDSAVAAMPNPPPDPLISAGANVVVLLGPEARNDTN